MRHFPQPLPKLAFCCRMRDVMNLNAETMGVKRQHRCIIYFLKRMMESSSPTVAKYLTCVKGKSRVSDRASATGVGGR